ncbi:hypothetical protein [Streptomyces huasconensis]|uniref:hypothetical protein n=1 Tax=Streptomyces huasconensis TaxID=1854574 RepID=UPI0036FA8179
MVRPLGQYAVEAGWQVPEVGTTSLGGIGDRAQQGSRHGQQRQTLAVWRDGHLTLGPLHLLEGELTPDEGTPVCRALRELGAVAGARGDEFTSVGLGEHRWTEKWLT